MKYIYPAIFRQDRDDSKWWNVSIPDVWGAVTCGDSFENAIFMAKDVLKCIYEMAPKSFKYPTSIEETKKNFPGEIVVPIEIELDNFEDVSVDFPRKIKENQVVRLDGKRYLIVGDLFNYQTARIFVLNKDGVRKKEILDKDKKYLICCVARVEFFDDLINAKR